MAKFVCCGLNFWSYDT